MVRAARQEDLYDLERLFEDIEAALGCLAGDRQGGEEHEDSFFSGDKQAVFAAGVADRRGVRFVLKLYADSEAFALNGGLAFEGHLSEPRKEILAESCCIFEKPGALGTTKPSGSLYASKE